MTVFLDPRVLWIPFCRQIYSDHQRHSKEPDVIRVYACPTFSQGVYISVRLKEGTVVQNGSLVIHIVEHNIIMELRVITAKVRRGGALRSLNEGSTSQAECLSQSSCQGALASPGGCAKNQKLVALCVA